MTLGGFGLSGAKTYSSSGTQQKSATKSSPAKSSTTMAAAKSSPSRSISVQFGGNNNRPVSAAQVSTGKGDFGGKPAGPTLGVGGWMGGKNAAEVAAFVLGKKKEAEQLENRKMEPTYAALSKEVAYRDPNVLSLLATGDQPANFAKERGLLTGIRALTPEETVRGGGTLLGSYNTNTGGMTYNPDAFDLYQDPRSMFNDPTKSISSIMSHEVFGHGVNAALGGSFRDMGRYEDPGFGIASLLGSPQPSTRYAGINDGPLENLNKVVGSMSMPTNPFYQKVYNTYVGDEAVARENNVRSMDKIGQYGAGTQAYSELKDLVPNTATNNEKYNHLQSIMKQRDDAIKMIRDNGLRTAQEYRLGLVDGTPRGLTVPDYDPSKTYSGFYAKPWNPDK